LAGHFWIIKKRVETMIQFQFWIIAFAEFEPFQA